MATYSSIPAWEIPWTEEPRGLQLRKTLRRKKESKQAPDVVTAVCCCSVTSVVSNSFATPRTVACQASLSKGFSQQEYWSGLPFHSPRALPGPRLKSKSPALAGGFSTTKPPGKPYTTFGNHKSNLFFCLFLKYN